MRKAALIASLLIATAAAAQPAALPVAAADFITRDFRFNDGSSLPVLK